MTKKLLVILPIFCCSLTFAQTIKTDVLVIGGSANGVAAALQSAHSKVKTILAVKDTSFGGFTGNGIVTIEANGNIPSGIWGEFRLLTRDHYKSQRGFDTAFTAPLKFEPSVAAAVFKEMTDSVKDLSVSLNSTFVSIKKDGERWEVVIDKEGKNTTIKARVVVDATENKDAVNKSNSHFPAGFDRSLNMYRTSIMAINSRAAQINGDIKSTTAGYPHPPSFYFPMKAVLPQNAENILTIPGALSGSNDIEKLPSQLQLGQGIGAIAAYCAFFKTTTQNLRVRTIQGELLDFKAYLLPFADVSQKDPYWRAVQQVSATGLLKGVERVRGKDAQFLFMPDSLVATAEIQPVLTEIYSRAFLWFGKEKPSDKFTLGNLLSFISDYTLTDPAVLKARIQRDWKALYTFSPLFDLNHQVTRREFAILANKYLNPFARTVDLNGNMVN